MTTALINAVIVTMENDKVIENGFIKIKDGIISEMGEMSEYKNDAEKEINIDKKTIYPGFIDAHSHLGMWEDSLGFEGDDGNECSDPCSPQLRAIDAVNPLERSFKDAYEAGVTCVVTGPGSANPIGGQMCALKTYGRRIDDMIVKEPLAIKFAFGENPKSTYNEKDTAPTTRMATAAIIREELMKAKKYLEDKKLSEEDDDVDAPEFDFKCESLIPLLERKIKAHMHAHRTDDIFTAIRIAKEFGIKAVIVHGTAAHTVADILKNEDISIITGPFLGSRTKPELQQLSAKNAGALSAVGIKTAICTDHPCDPIHLLGVCAGYAVREGMDYNSALKAVTINAAEICGISDRVGSLKVGKDADLAVYSCDPLSLYAKPHMVFVSGKRVL